MSEIETVSRMWMIAVPQAALNSSPLAKHHAEQLVDMAVAASVQSLKETVAELKKIEQDLMIRMSEYEQRSKGFHRHAMYKGKFEAFAEFMEILADEIKLYEDRIAANTQNNGQV